MGWRWANIRPRNSSSSRQPSSRSTARIHRAGGDEGGGEEAGERGQVEGQQAGLERDRGRAVAVEQAPQPARNPPSACVGASIGSTAAPSQTPQGRAGTRLPPACRGRCARYCRSRPHRRPCVVARPCPSLSAAMRRRGEHRGAADREERLRAPGRGWTAGRAGRRGRTRPGGSGVHATRLSHSTPKRMGKLGEPGRPSSWAAVRTGVAPRDLPDPRRTGWRNGCWQGTRLLVEHRLDRGSAPPVRRGGGMAAPAAGTAAEHGAGHAAGGLRGLTLAALGVAYGDIGTSPLYTLREAFGEAGGLHLGKAAVLGVLSLVFWSLVLIVSVKYVLLVLRADNRGEGGVGARHPRRPGGRRPGPPAGAGPRALAGRAGAVLRRRPDHPGDLGPRRRRGAGDRRPRARALRRAARRPRAPRPLPPPEPRHGQRAGCSGR